MAKIPKAKVDKVKMIEKAMPLKNLGPCSGGTELGRSQEEWIEGRRREVGRVCRGVELRRRMVDRREWRRRMVAATAQALKKTEMAEAAKRVGAKNLYIVSVIIFVGRLNCLSSSSSWDA